MAAAHLHPVALTSELIPTPLGEMLAVAGDDGIVLLDFQTRDHFDGEVHRLKSRLVLHGQAAVITSGRHPHLDMLRRTDRILCRRAAGFHRPRRPARDGVRAAGLAIPANHSLQPDPQLRPTGRGLGEPQRRQGGRPGQRRQLHRHRHPLSPRHRRRRVLDGLRRGHRAPNAGCWIMKESSGRHLIRACCSKPSPRHSNWVSRPIEPAELGRSPA